VARGQSVISFHATGTIPDHSNPDVHDTVYVF